MTTARARRPTPSRWQALGGDAESPMHAVATLAWVPLWEAMAMLAATTRDLRDVPELGGLAPRHTHALLALHHLGAAPIRGVAAALGISHSAASQTLLQMRERGIAVETHDRPPERRGLLPDGTRQSAVRRDHLHRLTPHGAELARLADEALGARLAVLAALFHETSAPGFAVRIAGALAREDVSTRTRRELERRREWQEWAEQAI